MTPENVNENSIHGGKCTIIIINGDMFEIALFVLAMTTKMYPRIAPRTK